MILYLLQDIEKNTLSFPMIAESTDGITKALEEMKISNASNLKITVLDSFEKYEDLLTLRFNKEEMQ